MGWSEPISASLFTPGAAGIPLIGPNLRYDGNLYFVQRLGPGAGRSCTRATVASLIVFLFDIVAVA